MRKLKSTVLYTVFMVFSIAFVNIQAQSDPILDAYKNYIEMPRELAYVHLNKSTYLKGEAIGFTAYVFDKVSLKPSKLTTNLYCTITDAKGKTIKEKLVLVADGVGFNLFKTDSVLASGEFTFKAYTNWMRNFKEQNHFQQTFRVIDGDNFTIDNNLPKTTNTNIDLQVLGEGGHMLYNTNNTVGIIAKDSLGHGVGNKNGFISDDTGTVVSEFKLNSVGLGKAFFNPEPEKSYNVHFEMDSTTALIEPIKGIKRNGLILSLSALQTKVSLQFKTNSKSVERLRNQSFKIAMHNGSQVNLSTFTLNDNGEAIVTFPRESLLPGMNIFTVLNNEDKPILERLYFNRKNILQKQVGGLNMFSADRDSINIMLNFKGVNGTQFSNLSVSVLPTETKSYNHNNNIFSQLYLQPYLKGTIENGAMYFGVLNRKTDYDLDLLLLTQGWSSYDWNAIFNRPPKQFFDFENGLTVIANKNSAPKKEDLAPHVFYTSTNQEAVLSEKENENYKKFTFKNVFPIEEDEIYVTNAYKQDNKKQLGLYLQSTPSRIPKLFNTTNVLSSDVKFIPKEDATESFYNFNNVNKENVLDEVVVTGQLDERQAKLNKIRASMFEKVYIPDDRDKRRFNTLKDFINFATPFRASYSPDGRLVVCNQRFNPAISNSRGCSEVRIFLDGTPVVDGGQLFMFPLIAIDYIKVSKDGFGFGTLAPNGAIMIYTDEAMGKNFSKKVTYKLPLLFSKNKKFYTPKYLNYKDTFYKNYGVIDWKPNLQIDPKGYINFRIKKPEVPFSLFIEGVMNNDVLYSSKINMPTIKNKTDSKS